MSKIEIKEGKVSLQTAKGTYSFEPEKEYMEIKEGGYILRKAAISRLIEGEGIVLSKPEPLGTEVLVAGRICVCVSATDGDRTVYELGSAGPDNLPNEICQKYPLEMAHNRAKQRAVLSLLGLSGTFYGEDEIDKSSLKKPTVPEAKQQYVPTNPPQYQQAPQQTPQQSPAPQGPGFYAAPQTYTQQPVQQNAPQQPVQQSPAPQDVLHPWTSNPQMIAEAQSSGIDPNTFLINVGKYKNYGYTAFQIMQMDPQAVEGFARLPLYGNADFDGAILACRQAILHSLS